MTGFCERIDCDVLCGIGRTVVPDVSEYAVVAVEFRRPQALAVHRNDALAVLAGGFGQELLEPRAEIGDAGRSDKRHFVAAAPRTHAQDQAEFRAGVLIYRQARRT